MMRKKLAWVLIIAALLGGCQSISYYSQAIGGQVNIWSKQRDISQVLEDPQLDTQTRERLRLALRARRFASRNLLLPDNESYSQYVKLERDYVVWNVVVTPRYSIEPLESCFPVVGCLSYRGYYSREDALKYARGQKQEGRDAWVGGVTAYSTLGWFDDPLLSTMLGRSDAELVGLIFHELAHQKIYLPDDTRFNESFATAVEGLGLRRWAMQRQADIDLDLYFDNKRKRQEIISLVLDARESMQNAYAEHAGAEEQKLAAIKQEQFSLLKQRYAKLRDEGGGLPGYDRFFSGELNNASLALFAEYHGWVRAFERLFEQHGADWESFYAGVEQLSRLPRAERDARLDELQESGS